MNTVFNRNRMVPLGALSPKAADVAVGTSECAKGYAPCGAFRRVALDWLE
jgi:hypothetical protein